MQNQRYSRDEFLEMFKQDVIRLSKYIPWLEDKSGDDVSKNYQDGNKMDHTLSFPVYDSILLAFLNDASTTVFMEKNYQYFYTKNHIHDYQDELAMIERADIMHMDILQCILSRYVFGGMVKAYLWKAGVDHKIFVTVIKKARQIVEFWSEPLVIEDEIPAEGYPEEFTYPEVDEADWTDEEFAAVLSGELNAEDIPRLRWEKEHATAGVENDEAVETVEAEIKEVVLPADFVFPEVDDSDWTDEEFAAVLAGELDPNDIPRMHYEKEHGVRVIFEGSDAGIEQDTELAGDSMAGESADENATGNDMAAGNTAGNTEENTAKNTDENTTGNIEETAGNNTEDNAMREEILPADFVFPEVDDADWTDEEFAAVLAGELDPDDIPRMHYEKEHGVKVVFGEPEMATESTQLEEAEPEPIESQESETESESESMETQESEIEPELSEESDIEPELPENPEIEPKLPEKPDIEPELPEEPEIEPELPENPDIEPELSEEPDIESELPEEPEIEPELPEKPEIEPELPQEPEVEPELPQESDIEPEQEAVAVSEPDDKPNDEPVTESQPIESSEETTPEQETEVPETDSDGETGALE